MVSSNLAVGGHLLLSHRWGGLWDRRERTHPGAAEWFFSTAMSSNNKLSECSFSGSVRCCDLGHFGFVFVCWFVYSLERCWDQHRRFKQSMLVARRKWVGVVASCSLFCCTSCLKFHLYGDLPGRCWWETEAARWGVLPVQSSTVAMLCRQGMRWIWYCIVQEVLYLQMLFQDGYLKLVVQFIC